MLIKAAQLTESELMGHSMKSNNNSSLIEKYEARLSELPRFAIPLFLCLVVSLVYANSFPGAFIFDDIHIVQNNALVKNLDLATIFRSDYWHGIDNTGLYRPLTILSLAVNRLVLGESPLVV